MFFYLFVFFSFFYIFLFYVYVFILFVFVVNFSFQLYLQFKMKTSIKNSFVSRCVCMCVVLFAAKQSQCHANGVWLLKQHRQQQQLLVQHQHPVETIIIKLQNYSNLLNKSLIFINLLCKENKPTTQYTNNNSKYDKKKIIINKTW